MISQEKNQKKKKQLHIIQVNFKQLVNPIPEEHRFEKICLNEFRLFGVEAKTIYLNRYDFHVFPSWYICIYSDSVTSNIILLG